MKNLSLLILAAAALGAAGCGAGDNTTEAENKAFKSGDKSAVKPPPAGANSAPSDFKSSINDGPKPGGGPSGN